MAKIHKITPIKYEDIPENIVILGVGVPKAKGACCWFCFKYKDGKDTYWVTIHQNKNYFYYMPSCDENCLNLWILKELR